MRRSNCEIGRRGRRTLSCEREEGRRKRERGELFGSDRSGKEGVLRGPLTTLGRGLERIKIVRRVRGQGVPRRIARRQQTRAAGVIDRGRRSHGRIESGEGRVGEGSGRLDVDRLVSGVMELVERFREEGRRKREGSGVVR